MGRHHAACGALVGLALGLVSRQPAATVLAAGAVCAGAAMLPDLDEPGSSVARSAEPVSGAVSWATARLAGGHRQATHCLLAVLCACGGTAALGALHVGSWPLSAGLVAICLTLAVRALLPVGARPGKLSAIGLGPAFAWAITRFAGLGWWVPAAIGFGWLAHIAGDWLTLGGVPLLWPVSARHFAWPILGRTGSGRESVLGVGLALAAVALAIGPARAVIATVR